MSDSDQFHPRRAARFRSRIVALVGLLGLTGTSPSHGQAEGHPILHVGTSGDYAPFSVQGEDSLPTGFDIAVAQRLGEDLHRPVRFVSFRWPELMQGLEKGDFDVAMSGVTVRPDRALQARFSRPYAIGGAVAVLRRERKMTERSVAALARKAIRICVNAGGHLERVARQTFPKATFITTHDNHALPAMLRSRTCEAVISDSFEVATWQATDFVVVGPFTHDHKAYLVDASSTDLRREIDAWLRAREADGWLNEQRRTYLGRTNLLTEAEVCSEALAGAVHLRLQMMPYVAAAKRRDRVPIDDPAQEKRVLDNVRSSATNRGLDPGDVARLFETLFRAAKMVQRDSPADLPIEKLQLDDLRAGIGSISGQILEELERCLPLFHRREEFRSRLHRALARHRLPTDVQRQIADALARVRNRTTP